MIQQNAGTFGFLKNKIPRSSFEIKICWRWILKATGFFRRDAEFGEYAFGRIFRNKNHDTFISRSSAKWQ